MLTLAALAVSWRFGLPIAGSAERAFEVVFFPPFVLGLATAGALIWTRLPANRVGPIASWAGLSWALAAAVGEYVSWVNVLAPAGQPLRGATRWVAWFGDLNIVPLVGLSIFLLLLFPTGDLPSTRWRSVAVLIQASALAGLVGHAFAPGPLVGAPLLSNPIGLEGLPGKVATILRLGIIVLMGVCLPATVGSLFARFRNATEKDRQQLKWFVFASALAAVAVLWALLASLAGASEPVPIVPLLIVLPALPLAIAIAVLRYRLYEIDRIISRTVTYGLVGAVLVAVYAGGVFVVQILIPASGDLAVAGSTLAVAAFFSPLRRRVQTRVHRRFNRAHYDAAQVLEEMATKLQRHLDLEPLVGYVVGVVHATMAPAHTEMWLRPSWARILSGEVRR